MGCQVTTEVCLIMKRQATEQKQQQQLPQQRSSRIQSLSDDLWVSLASFLNLGDQAALARTCQIARAALTLNIRGDKGSPGLQRLASVVMRCVVNSKQGEWLMPATLAIGCLVHHTRRLQRLKIVIDDVNTNAKEVSEVKTLRMPVLPATLHDVEVRVKWDFADLDTGQLLKALTPCAERLQRLKLQIECVGPTHLPHVAFPELRHLQLEWTCTATCPLFAMAPALETLDYYCGARFNPQGLGACSQHPEKKGSTLKEMTLRLRECQTINLLDCTSLQSFACLELWLDDNDDDPHRYHLPTTVERFHLTGWKVMPNVWMTLSKLRRLELNVDPQYSADMDIPTRSEISRYCPLLESFVLHAALGGGDDVDTIQDWIVGLGLPDCKQLPHLQLFVVCRDEDDYGERDFWTSKKQQIDGRWYLVGIGRYARG